MNRKKKKIYKIVWEGTYSRKVSLIIAKNEEQALKRFYRKYNSFVPSIISFKEYKIEVLKDE